MSADRSRMYVYGQDGILTGNFRVYDDYAIDRPHGRDDWLIMYTLEGRGALWTPAGDEPCEAGDIAILRPGLPHRYGTAKGHCWHFYWVHFPAGEVDQTLLPDAGMAVRHLEERRIRSRTHRAFRRIMQDAGEQAPYWYELCIGALKEVLALSLRGEQRTLDPRVAEVMRLIAIRTGETIRIDALAEEVGLSPSRLAHLFKSETGRSIIETLNAMRIRQAALMLEYTRLSTAEIAYAVGYQNYNHFLNQFRKRYGSSPTAYRRRAGTDGSGPKK